MKYLFLFLFIISGCSTFKSTSEEVNYIEEEDFKENKSSTFLNSISSSKKEDDLIKADSIITVGNKTAVYNYIKISKKQSDSISDTKEDVIVDTIATKQTNYESLLDTVKEGKYLTSFPTMLLLVIVIFIIIRYGLYNIYRFIKELWKKKLP